MASTAYARGRAFEYRVANHFRSLGYIVTRSPKSKTAVDLFVIGHRVVLFVQCKVDGVLPPAEWNELFDMCDQCSAIPVLIARERRKIVCYQMLHRKRARGPQPRVRFTPLKNEKEKEALVA